MSFLIDVVNGVQRLVSATASAVGAEPALSDPGPGTWYLRSIGAIRSWVASIPWAGVDKTGAVASDVGALPSLTLGGDVDANSINSGSPCVVKFQGVTSWANFPFSSVLMMAGKGGSFTQLAGKDGGVTQCWSDLADGTTYRRNYATSYGWAPWAANWDSYNLPVGSTGKNILAASTQSAARSAISALPVANPTATGTLTAPDVVVSNRAGTGTRMATLDSAGKIGAEEKPYRDRQFVQNDTAGTSTLKTFTVWNWLIGAAELVIAGSFNNSNGTYSSSSTVSVYHGGWLLASVSVTIPVSGSEVPFKIRVTPPSVGGFNQAVADVQTPTGSQITIVGADEPASTAMRIECTNAYSQQESRIHNVSIL